jgi:exopolyphosphatase/guanosine-5'-triphosphate,3'-diphosphate pyrophosphatase
VIKASIDIGSNSILLLIADVSEQSIKPMHEEYHFPRLGKGVSETNMLNKARMDMAEDILRTMIKVAARYNCQRIIAAATAAVREARNGGDFTDRIRNSLDLKIHILNGEEEAELTYLGATSSHPSSEEDLVVIDIGGGSSEVILGKGQCPLEVKSAPIGAVKLFDQYGKNPGLVPAAMETIDGAISKVAKASRGSHLLSVGGTATTLAAIKLKLSEYDADALEGLDVTYDEITEMIELFRELTVEEIRGLPGMEPGRADIIEAGATILQRFMELGRHNSFRVTSRGLRFGMLLRY